MKSPLVNLARPCPSLNFDEAAMAMWLLQPFKLQQKSSVQCCNVAARTISLNNCATHCRVVESIQRGDLDQGFCIFVTPAQHPDYNGRKPKRNESRLFHGISHAEQLPWGNVRGWVPLSLDGRSSFADRIFTASEPGSVLLYIPWQRCVP